MDQLAMGRHLSHGFRRGEARSIDYRWDDRSFWFSAHDCQVTTPTTQNLDSRTANSDLWSWPTHQLLGRLKSTNPNLQIYSPKKAISEKLGFGIDNPCRIVFWSSRMKKCLERVNDRHFWDPGVFSYAMIPRCRPNSRVFFFIVTSVVYGT
jgi:hypothetical protein